MNLFVLVYLVFFMPTLLRISGQPIDVAIKVHDLLRHRRHFRRPDLGWAGDRIRSLYTVLALGYVGGAVFITVAAFSIHDTAILIRRCSSAASASMAPAVAQHHLGIFYPTRSARTGIGWALGVGRIGAVIGPLVGGYLIRTHWPVPAVILANTIPAAIAARRHRAAAPPARGHDRGIPTGVLASEA